MKPAAQELISFPSLPDCQIEYYPRFLEKDTADRYFDHLYSEVPWRQDNIRIFGKTYPQPRLTALFGNNGKTYTYSGITMSPLPFDAILEEIRKKVQQLSGCEFSTCLLNLYRDGSDSNGWHADNEKELGNNPVIASVSLGQPRYFQMKHRRQRDQKLKILLEPGSLLLMKGPTQHHWLHQLPKSKKPMQARINLTFRYIQ